MAVDMYDFLVAFFIEFSEFALNDFYITGESCACFQSFTIACHWGYSAVISQLFGGRKQMEPNNTSSHYVPARQKEEGREGKGRKNE